MPDLVVGTGPTLAALSLIILLPGLLIGAAAGLRGWLLVAGAPALTFGLVGTAGSVLPALGFSWTPVALVASALATAAGAAAIGLGVRRWHWSSTASRAPWRTVDHVAVAGAVLVSALVGLAVVTVGTDRFTAIPQFWDTAFHSNAIRYIADTGASSPSALAALSDPAGDFYYPNAFHVVGATLVMVTGTEVVVALELLAAVLPALFALGVAALVRTVSGRPAIAVASALLACAFSAFPYDLAGVLLPYVMGLALLPAFVGQWCDVLRPGRQVTRAVALGLGAVGLLALHPSAVVAAAVFCAAYAVQQWWTHRPGIDDAVVVGVGAVATGVLGAPLLLASASAAAGEPFDWPVEMLAADAVGRLLTLGHGHDTPQWWLAGLVGLGLLGLRRHRALRFLATSGGLFAVIFVMAASYEGPVVELLSRPWWNDRWRLVALWVVAVVPLAGAGLVAVRDAVLDAVRLPVDRRRAVPAALLAVLLAGLVLVTGGLQYERNRDRIALAFTDGPAVSAAERDAFARLATLVPPDGRVMNDPYDGSPMMYALEGVRPVFVQPLHQQLDLAGLTADRRLLFTSFNRLDTDPRVREVVREHGITHAVVSGGLVYTAPGEAPGMQDLDDVESLQLLFRTPTTTAYEVRMDTPVAAG